MSVYLDDGDVKLYHGDALETLRQMPADSVDCVVTSPPYWGLRDYGTGEWDGGDPDCDHTANNYDRGRLSDTDAATTTAAKERITPFRHLCGKCGARRVDRQMGLEPTPDLFVHNMVELFREIRRVLAPHGTCWVNLGDSYASAPAGNTKPRDEGGDGAGRFDYSPSPARVAHQEASRKRMDKTAIAGLKPKDLCGIPWKVAFALQADGWWLRSDIIWAKPNPMPESVTDRPTKAHEYVFLLTKQPRYWFDTEAVREPLLPSSVARGEYGHSSFGKGQFNGSPSDERHQDGKQVRKVADLQNPAGRNVRSVWMIATQPYPEAHFATFPEELARRCILAGCPIRVCRVCGKPSERIVESNSDANGRNERIADYDVPGLEKGTSHDRVRRLDGKNYEHVRRPIGWSECGCNHSPLGHPPQLSKWRPGVVLDPFIGSGTTAKVARDHQRHAIGIDLNQTYLELAARRLQQLSLLAGGTA